MSKAVDGTANQPRASLHSVHSSQPTPAVEEEGTRRKWHQSLLASFKEPGSALQIIVAATTAVTIGVSVSATVGEVPEAAPVILEIPGTLWLRALRATVLPLIITAIILAMQKLREMARDGAKLARCTIIYYVATTIIAVVHSQIMTDLVWRRLMVQVGADSLVVAEDDQETIEEREDNAPHDIVVQVFESFIPSNIFAALAEDSLLAVLVSAVVVGLLIKGPDSSLLRAVKEVERIVMIIITFLIKLAPIGVFFLILANLLTLDIADIGVNLGVLIGGSVAGMFIHLFIVLPIIFFIFGTASSVATLPVSLRCVKARGVPDLVAKFTVPLGCLINMDGTAIYFPMVVVSLASTQGISLNAADYTIIVLLSTLSSIATTPIPSSSLVLTVMIANSVGIPITGMYAVVVAIDWFIDRFRTATNVSGDLYAAIIMQQITGINDLDAKDIIVRDPMEVVGGDEQKVDEKV